MDKLDKALQQQIDLNKTKNMLYSQLGEIIEIDPDFLAALEELIAGDQREFSERELQDAISFASGMLLKRLYFVNQFLQIDEQKKHTLESIYLHTWQRIVETKDIQPALKEYHYPELTNWIASLYPPSFLEPLREGPTIGQIVCEEYSPHVQIDLLRLDVRALKQPLLDIGCGSTAGLTRYLRTLGIQAYGIDRHIEKKETYLQQTSWMDYEFKPDTWGTIISNMAFTNHLLYVKNHDRAQLKLYLQKFKQIIESLMVGGRVHYAPNVSFIEERLDVSRYRAERFEVVREIHMTRIMKIAK
jgi:hypothetical protein